MLGLWGKKGKKDGKRETLKVSSYRLPKNAIANHYTVCFKPFLKELRFEGSVAIDMTLTENSPQIILNSSDLVISKVMWEEDVTQNRQEPMEMQVLERGQLSLLFDPFLVPQKGQLRMNFKGRINEKKMQGFYRSKCKINENEFNLITQFEPSDARRCFPCMDDPQCKAPFDICLIVPKGLTVVGNMPIKVIYDHKRDPALNIVEFKQTPPMSAYTIALVVGSFEYIEGRSTDNETPIRVYTPVGDKEEGKFALEIACNILPFLAEYFDTPYPLQKLDLISISDFASSAEENWGLIMFQESHILLDADSGASAADKQYIALIVCEAIVKQWIGNLVTVNWWSQLWLKEGLATFLRYFCMEEIQPEFECSTHFVTEIVQKALRIDAFKSTHPMETPVHNSLEAEELFDEIVFKKGAAIVRMLYNYIGDESFKSGLSLYFKRFKYKSATAEDMWKCFEEASSKPVASVIGSWICQKGFPLVKITSKQDGKNRYLKLTQEKFTVDPSGRDLRGGDSTWSIPLNVTSESDPTSVIFHTLMDSKTTTLVIPDVSKTDWLKLNPGAIGFYRVRYPTDMLQLLVHAIRDKSLEPVDRLNILDDQFALLISGMGGTVEILTFLEAYIDDEDYNCWCAISSVFDRLLKVFDYVNLEDSVRHFGRYLFARILERVGFNFRPDEHHHQTLLRTLILREMTKFNHHETNEKCRILYEHFVKGEQQIPVELHYVVYNSVLSTGDEDTVKHFLKMYKESHSVEDKDRIANALGSVGDLQMIKYVLEFSISDEVRKQDTVFMIIAISKTKDGRELAWAFFKENFALFKYRYGPALASRLIKGVAEDFASEEKAQEVTDFFKANSFPGTDRAVQQVIENIRVNEAWLKRERNLTTLQDYLEADSL